MTIALWCLLIAILLPYCMTIFAKFQGDFGPKQNHNPREFLTHLDGIRKRANWAQLNSFEILPGFVAAVLVAQFVGAASQSVIDGLAIAFVVSRIIYCFCYLADKATLRSLVWFVGVACIVALFVVSA